MLWVTHVLDRNVISQSLSVAPSMGQQKVITSPDNLSLNVNSVCGQVNIAKRLNYQFIAT